MTLATFKRPHVSRRLPRPLPGFASPSSLGCWDGCRRSGTIGRPGRSLLSLHCGSSGTAPSDFEDDPKAKTDVQSDVRREEKGEECADVLCSKALQLVNRIWQCSYVCRYVLLHTYNIHRQSTYVVQQPPRSTSTLIAYVVFLAVTTTQSKRNAESSSTYGSHLFLAAIPQLSIHELKTQQVEYNTRESQRNQKCYAAAVFFIHTAAVFSPEDYILRDLGGQLPAAPLASCEQGWAADSAQCAPWRRSMRDGEKSNGNLQVTVADTHAASATTQNPSACMYASRCFAIAQIRWHEAHLGCDVLMSMGLLHLPRSRCATTVHSSEKRRAGVEGSSCLPKKSGCI